MKSHHFKRYSLFPFVFLFATAVLGDSGKAYLDKFSHYLEWSQHLPKTPDEAFINFINDQSPLSSKLREKWLYQLAYNKDWVSYLKYYQPSNDLGLQCYKELALYQRGKIQEAVSTAKNIWLSGNPIPSLCNPLFALLIKNKYISENLIATRIHLALEKNNLPLALYLLKQYSPSRQHDLQTLTAIHKNPTRILGLTPGGLNTDFYLYGLNRLVVINMDKAISHWKLAKTRQMLNHPAEQHFLATMAEYKALRDQPDAKAWFNKVNPTFYTDSLLNAEIRYALKNQDWPHVLTVIRHSPDKENPCWQYWIARAKEALGHKDEAFAIYETLSHSRNYYGFLASLRMNRSFSFENEQATSSLAALKAYQPFTNKIKALYLSKQLSQASRLLNDFIIELPKTEQSALAYWISNDLKWHGKSVYLCNNDQLSNQLSLRFPLAYQNTIMTYSKTYAIPKEFIYAIIRQESAFRDDAVSSAGASGLMQLMPTTAKIVSKTERIAYSNQKQLFSSSKNINIGVAYLQQLAKSFQNHPILMAAAYNAGPKQVRFWMKNHPPKEMDLWIETLPWVETRNYLKNVIAFYAVYQYRLHEKPNLKPFMEGVSFN